MPNDLTSMLRTAGNQGPIFVGICLHCLGCIGSRVKVKGLEFGFRIFRVWSLEYLLGPWVKSYGLVLSRIDPVCSRGFCQNASIGIFGQACKLDVSVSVQLLFAIPMVPGAGPKSRAGLVEPSIYMGNSWC